MQNEIEAGDYAAGLKDAERGRALAHEHDDAKAEWRFRLQQATILMFISKPEEASRVLDAPMPETAEFAPMQAEHMLLRARILGRDSRADGLALLYRARQAAERAGAGPVLVDVDQVRSQWTEGAESEAILTGAREIAHSIGSPYQEAGILVNLGLHRIFDGRFDEAAGIFEEASRLAGPSRKVLYATAQQNLAACYTNLGETDRAIDLNLKSVETLKRAGSEILLAGALGELGRAWSVKEEPAKAAPYLEQALSLCLKNKTLRNAAVFASNLSVIYRGTGDLDRADTFNRQSLEIRETLKLPTQYNHVNAGWIAVERGDRQTAEREFRLAAKDRQADVVWDCEHGLGKLAVKENKPAEALRHFEAAVAEVEKRRASLASADFKLPFLTQLIRLYRDYVDTLLAQGQIERALAVADSSRAQVLSEHAGAGAVRRLPPGALRELARQAHAVLLSYWLGPKGSHAWVVTATELRHVDLPPAAEIEALVRDYRGAVEQQLADPARSRLPSGEKLFAAVVEPVRRWIPAGSRVIVAPDGALHGLNLESLPLPGNEPRYWIEDVTISIAPALSLLAASRPAADGGRLLLIGDPASTDPAYPRLPNAAAEMAAVRRQFGEGRAIVVDGPRATPAAWRAAELDAFSVIHFTAHAVANAESPLDSAVVLTGGKVYARDAMGTKLTANLVTLSACRGVGTRLYSGEGLVGFAWAFLHAGAHNVIAGLWDVNDQSTAALMETLYRELGAGRTPADALRTAKLALLKSPGNLRKPYYWAPFQLYTTGW